ncbi:MAG: type II toxin-antitoxin system CcdA family antitoxin [Nitrososphaerales archaeon]|nr:type II toxin-antitoxin system CcdA family antitoxin [Nitrososphaerales archaeon]
MTGTVVVRVDEKLKRKLKRFNVNFSEVVRSALKQEVERQEKAALVSALAKARGSLSKVSDERIIRAVRETRDTR